MANAPLRRGVTRDHRQGKPQMEEYLQLSFDGLDRQCEVPGCERRTLRRRWCEAHYMRLYRTGGTWSRSDGWADDCEVCGTALALRRGGKPRKYCGPGCGAVAARAHGYGLSVRDYLDLFNEQGGCCHICGRALRLRGPTGPFDKRHDRACVDHDHKTGKVRGMLCGPCNHAIGELDDDPDRAEAAARYLRKHCD
jgi:Recombination endonuclease VII